MKTTKVSELVGAALDWAVGDIEFERLLAQGSHVKQWVLDDHRKGLRTDPYSTDWLFGGPIIEQVGIAVKRGNDLYFPNGNEKGEHYEPLWLASVNDIHSYMHGRTCLEAAMRCYVVIRRGLAVEVPEGLSV